VADIGGGVMVNDDGVVLDLLGDPVCFSTDAIRNLELIRTCNNGHTPIKWNVAWDGSGKLYACPVCCERAKRNINR
jgi:hypothetical protein